MDAPLEEYLKPTPAIDCDSPSIKEKAQSLIREREKDTERAKCLFYFVRDEIKYDLFAPHYLPEHFRASATLARGEGYCVQKAILLSALARAVNIPVRVGFARIRNNVMPQWLIEILGTNILPCHGYSELYIERKWVKATPAFDLEMCQRNRYLPVEFDGKSDAMFPSYTQDGERHMDYLKYLGYYQDPPVDEIVDNLKRRYPPEYINKQRIHISRTEAQQEG